MFVSVSFNEASPELANHKQIKVPIQKGNRVADVMDYIKNRYPDLPVKRESHLVLVNRRITSFEQVLNEDDEISFTPIIGGG